MTQGRATYSMEFDHYAPLPANLADEMVAKARLTAPGRADFGFRLRAQFGNAAGKRRATTTGG